MEKLGIDGLMVLPGAWSISRTRRETVAHLPARVGSIERASRALLQQSGFAYGRGSYSENVRRTGRTKKTLVCDQRVIQ